MVEAHAALINDTLPKDRNQKDQDRLTIMGDSIHDSDNGDDDEDVPDDDDSGSDEADKAVWRDLDAKRIELVIQLTALHRKLVKEDDELELLSLYRQAKELQARIYNLKFGDAEPKTPPLTVQKRPKHRVQIIDEQKDDQDSPLPPYSRPNPTRQQTRPKSSTTTDFDSNPPSPTTPTDFDSGVGGLGVPPRTTPRTSPSVGFRSRMIGESVSLRHAPCGSDDNLGPGQEYLRYPSVPGQEYLVPTKSEGYVYDEYRVCDKCKRKDFGVFRNAEGLNCCTACSDGQTKDTPILYTCLDDKGKPPQLPERNNTHNSAQLLSIPKRQSPIKRNLAKACKKLMNIRRWGASNNDTIKNSSHDDGNTFSLTEEFKLEAVLDVVLDNIATKRASKRSSTRSGQGFFGPRGLLVDTQESTAETAPKLTPPQIADTNTDEKELFGTITQDNCVARAVYTFQDHIMDQAYFEERIPAENMWKIMDLPVRKNIANFILDEFDHHPDPNIQFQTTTPNSR